MKKLFFIILSFLLIFSIRSKDNNKITYYKTVDSIHWRAIITFTDTNQISEDWNWFYYDIEEACKEKSIFLSHSQLNNDYVDVGPSDKPIFKINIS